MGEQWKQWLTLFSLAPKWLQMVTVAMKLKDTYSLESYDQPIQRIKRQRHYFAIKGPSSQDYGLFSNHVWRWELNYKESWAPKNWCLWTVVLEKTLESPLDCKEIQPVNLILKEISLEYSLEGLMLRLKPSILSPPDAKCWLIGKASDAWKDRGQEEKRATENKIVGWHHRLNVHEFAQTQGKCKGQESLVCCLLCGSQRVRWG